MIAPPTLDAATVAAALALGARSWLMLRPAELLLLRVPARQRR